MTDRTMSPAAAQAHAKRAIRSRYKAIRLGKRVEDPSILAGRLAALLKDAAAENPGEWNEAYVEWAINQFSAQYLRLCEVAPIPERVSARRAGLR